MSLCLPPKQTPLRFRLCNGLRYMLCPMISVTATRRASAIPRYITTLPSSVAASPPRLRIHLILLSLFVLSCVLLLHLLPRPHRNRAERAEVYPVVELDDGPPPPGFEMVLEGAAMEDGTVILTTLNTAWAEVVDLFLESFRRGERTRWLLDHLVVLALDRGAYARCEEVHPHCVMMEMEGMDLSGEKAFMTEGYLRMMWRRIDFLREVLQKGFHFIFTDTDVLWFRNPLPYFYADVDLQIACDHYVGTSDDLHNQPNGGFMYARSNNRTIQFYKFWYSSRLEYPGYHDQHVLNFIKSDPFLTEIGLEIRFLDTAHFGGLCEPSTDLNKVCTMHTNCCIGLERKLHDLRVMLEDWRRFMSIPPSLKGSRLTSWNVPQKCSLAPLYS